MKILVPTERGNEVNRLFLTNLDNEVSETKNVAPEHPDIVARLKKLHEQWVEQVQEP